MEKKLKIVADNKIPFLKGRLDSVAEVVYASPDAISRDLVKDADALIIRTRTKCGRELLEGTGVKLVVTATIGMDHIDTEWCQNNGIEVRNAAGCNAPGVAQYVWSALFRNGFDPLRDTLGVVGYGHIGSIVAQWGRKFGCRVIVCDPPRVKAGHRDLDYHTLDELLYESDAVTLHTPLTFSGEDATFHLMDADRLSKLRRGALLINASRGEVVDNGAWAKHLAEGWTKAVVDTWEGEPNINLQLLSRATIATPHIAGYSYEGKQRATRMSLEAIEDFFGVPVDKSGLAGDYQMPESMTTETICSSYDPFVDTSRLKSLPERFEQLRSEYDYRHEP